MLGYPRGRRGWRPALVALLLARAASGAPAGHPKSEVVGVAPHAGPLMIADAGFIYWVSEDPAIHAADMVKPASFILERMDRETGRSMPLFAETGDSLIRLAQDERFLYWSGWERDDLWRVAKAGGQPERLDRPAHKMQGTVLAVDALYATEKAPGAFGVLRLSKEGGVPTIFAAAHGLSIPLGVSGGQLYWFEEMVQPQSNRWMLHTTPLAGGQTRSLVELDNVGAIPLLDDRGLFFTTNDAVEVYTPGTGRRTLARTTKPVTCPLALDRRSLYWAAGKTVNRVALIGGAPEVIVTGGEPACGMVVDGNELFWLDRPGDKRVVMRTMLPRESR
jgi:hypothetical protein